MGRERKQLLQQISDTLIKPRYFSLHLLGVLRLLLLPKFLSGFEETEFQLVPDTEEQIYARGN